MATKTLLNAVNEIFKRVNVIAGDAAALTSLVDSARQHPIDVAVQVVNEGMDRLFAYSEQRPIGSSAEATLTLVTNQNEYTLPTDLEELHFPLIDKVNTQFIFQFPGGYDMMLEFDPEQDDTGLPYYAAINPATGKLHMDRLPEASDAGHVYTFQYQKDIAVSNATDVLPITNVCFRQMVPAWVQLYKREMRNEFDQVLFSASIALAAKYTSEIEPRRTYSSRAHWGALG